tara:strand:+ start:1071 stop:1757 length:687 start_codon:yes stop_codon:yes gene_type:complete
MRKYKYLRAIRRRNIILRQAQNIKAQRQLIKKKIVKNPDYSYKQTGRGKRVWGPLGWYFIHTFTQACPDNATSKNIELYKNMIHTFTDLLPCPYCKTHFKNHLKSNPMKFSNKNDMVIYFMNFHNQVNRRLKKGITFNKEKLLSHYSNPNFGRLKKFVNYWKVLMYETHIDYRIFKKFLKYYIFLFPSGDKKTKLYELSKKYPIDNFFTYKLFNKKTRYWFSVTLNRI